MATGWSDRTAGSSPSGAPDSTARPGTWPSNARWWPSRPPGDRAGYWLVASDGGVFAFGDSGYYGSLPGLGFSPAGSPAPSPWPRRSWPWSRPPTGPDTSWCVRRGCLRLRRRPVRRVVPGHRRVLRCGCGRDARTPPERATGWSRPPATSTPSAMPTSSGAPPERSVPVTSAVRTPDGGGYWILFGDGRVNGFGDAANHGNPAGTLGGDTATTIFATSDGGGYWVGTASERQSTTTVTPPRTAAWPAPTSTDPSPPPPVGERRHHPDPVVGWAQSRRRGSEWSQSASNVRSAVSRIRG